MADGEILAFLDADCLPDPDWLSNGVSSLQREACITGSTYDVADHAPWVEQAWFTQRETGRVATSHINSGNLFCTRKLFDAIDGFDATLVTGEDTAFCSRAARRVTVISDDSIRVVHLGNPTNLRDFLRWEIWYGLGAFGTFKHAWFDKPLMGTLAFAALTVSQVVGVFRWLIAGQPHLLLTSTLLVLLLLLVTVVHRRRFIRKLTQAAQLLVL